MIAGIIPNRVRVIIYFSRRILVRAQQSNYDVCKLIRYAAAVDNVRIAVSTIWAIYCFAVSVAFHDMVRRVNGEGAFQIELIFFAGALYLMTVVPNMEII